MFPEDYPLEPTDTGTLTRLTDPRWREIPGATELIVTIPNRTIEYVCAWNDFTGYSMNSLIDWSVMTLDVADFTALAIKAKEPRTKDFRRECTLGGEETRDFTIEGQTAEVLRALANVTGWTLNMIVNHAIRVHAEIRR